MGFTNSLEFPLGTSAIQTTEFYTFISGKVFVKIIPTNHLPRDGILYLDICISHLTEIVFSSGVVRIILIPIDTYSEENFFY